MKNKMIGLAATAVTKVVMATVDVVYFGSQAVHRLKS